MYKRKTDEDWKIGVKFQQSGALLATATGVLLVPPKDAVAFVTDAAGDDLFRVIERKELAPSPSGCRRVEVTNQAAIRVLAWKLWSKSNVIYEIQRADRQAAEGQQEERVTFELVSSSMLQSLTGSWQLRPIKIHTSDLPLHITHPLGATAAAAAAAAPGTPTAAAAEGALSGSKAPLPQCNSSSSASHSFKLGPILNTPAVYSSSSSSSTAQPAGDTISSWAPGHLRVRTLDPKCLESSSSSNSSSSSSTAKPSLLQKLALLSPKSRAAAAAAGGVFGSPFRPVVQITARTSSGHSAESLSAGGSMHAANGSMLAANGSMLLQLAAGGSILAAGGGGQSGSLGGGSERSGVRALPAALAVDADGFVTATYVHYKQLAQPKGMPPGIRNVPGLSYAVAASVGKEVRQMLDKVSCVSHYAVSQGLGPQEALRCVVQQVEAAGGSFKALQKQLHKQAPKTHKQLASAGGDSAAASAAAAAAVGYAGVGYTGFAISPLMGTYSDLQLAAEKGGKDGKGEKGGSDAAVLRLSASTADDDAGDAAVGGMAGVLNPVLQRLSLAEGLVAGCKTPAGMREVMSHPVAWADAAELDD